MLAQGSGGSLEGTRDGHTYSNTLGLRGRVPGERAPDGLALWERKVRTADSRAKGRGDAVTYPTLRERCRAAFERAGNGLALGNTLSLGGWISWELAPDSGALYSDRQRRT